MSYGVHMCASFCVSGSTLAEMCILYLTLYTGPMHIYYPAYDIYACLHGTDVHACLSVDACECAWVGVHICMSACLTGVYGCLHINIVQERMRGNIFIYVDTCVSMYVYLENTCVSLYA